MTFELTVLGVIVGLLAGGGARLVARDGGHGLVADLALGVLGSFLAAWVFRVLGLAPEAGLVGLILVVLAGAASLIVAQRKIWPTAA